MKTNPTHQIILPSNQNYEEIGSNDAKIIAKKKESEDFKDLFL
tara:strand:+ start:797 stop:925 length:129 start_codon:yes stop_codon:yes gene_type:complete